MSKPTLSHWIAHRRAIGATEAPIIFIRPEDNVLIGLDQILNYLKVNSVNTLYQWVELYGFPAVKRIDGMWMSTMTSIDQWIFMACAADNANRPVSRGYSKRHDIAKRRLDARVNERNLRIARGEAPEGKDGPRPSWTGLGKGLEKTS